MVCLLRQESEAFMAFKDFHAWVLTQLDKRIKCLHMDQGGEYLSEAFITFLDEKGIEWKLNVHDTPEQNGVAERLNHTLIEKVCAMMILSQLPCNLWGEALMHAVWLKNRTWTRALPKGVTLYELVMGDAPVLCDTPIWGTTVWVHDTSLGKLGIWATKGCWIRYDLNSDGHRVYWRDAGNVTVEHSVVFSREEIPCVEDLLVEGIMVETEGENDDEGEKEVSINPEVTEMEPVPIEPIPAIPAIPENPTMPDVRCSTCNKQPSHYVRDLASGEFTTGSEKEKIPTGLQVPELNEEVLALAMLARMSEANGLELRTHVEVMKCPHWLQWKEVMDEEMGALEAHKTWEVVDAPKGMNIVGSHWTFVLKRDALGSIVRYKAQLVVQGFSQVQGIDFFDTYAPVAKMATIRTVLALAAHHDHKIHQVDIKNVFLNGAFEDNEMIYMKLLPATELTKEKGKVLRLLKPLYGLSQSAQHWYSCLWGVLRDGLKMK